MGEVQSRRRNAFWSAFWGAVSTPGLLFAADDQRITRIQPPACAGGQEAMRGDWVRIGKDFNHVIAREEAATKR